MLHKYKKIFIILAVVLIMQMLSLSMALAADTKNESVIKEKFHQIVFLNEDGTLKVKEVIGFINTTADRFIGNKGASGQTEVLKVSLPQGYRDLEVQSFDKNNIITSPEGFITTLPVEGNADLNVIFTYKMPQSTNGIYVLDKYAKYTIDELVVFHAQGKMKVSGAGVYSYKPQNVPGQGTFEVYGVQPPSLNKKVDIKVDLNYGSSAGLPDADKVEFHPHVSSRSEYASTPLIGKYPHIFTLFVLVIVGALIAFIYTNKRKQQEEKIDQDEEEQLINKFTRLNLKEKRLLAKISELESQFKAGETSEEAYQATLAEYQKLLAKVKIYQKIINEELNELED